MARSPLTNNLMTVCAKFDCPNEVAPNLKGGRKRLYCSDRCSRVVQQWRRMWRGWQWDELHCPWCLVWFATRTPAKLYCTKQCQRRAYYRENERTEPKEWGE